MTIKNYSVAIFNHHQGGTTDATQHLLDYLMKMKRVTKIVNVRFPFLVSENGKTEIRIFQKNNAVQYDSSIKFYKPQILSYIKDFILALYYGCKHCRKIDIYFGSPNILALAGIILKKAGVVRKVIYYTIDYTPRKYTNGIINEIYFIIDKYVCYHSDEVWSLNESMIESRIKDHGWDMKKITIKIVPFGNHSNRFKPSDYLGYDRNTIVYFGGISQDKGAELFVPIAKYLKKNGNNDFKFLVMGGGKVDWLKSEVKKTQLDNYFEITGSIDTLKEVEKRLIKCGVALAPYYPENKNNFSYYSDPGKVKEYLGCGLPIIITAVPPIAQDIQNNNIGLIAKYDAEDFSYKISEIIRNKIKYLSYRKNAIKWGKKYSWNTIFKKALANLVI